MFYDLTPSVIPEFSVAHEKLAVWLVVVVGIAAVMEFFFGLFLCFLEFSCLFFILGERWGEPLDPPLLMSTFWVLIKKIVLILIRTV